MGLGAASLKNEYAESDWHDAAHSPIPEELIAAREARDREERRCTRKTLIATWLTAVAVPGLFLLSVMPAIGHAGLGGMIALRILIPLLIVALVILRLFLKPYFKALFIKGTNHILRRTLICIGSAVAIGFMLILWNNALGPNGSVKASVADVPEIEAYFFRHKEEIEHKRMDAQDNDYFYVEYPYNNGTFPLVGFIFDEGKSANTGYHGKYLYTYRLDDRWYIEILLPPAN